jgi:hypothetical protein
MGAGASLNESLSENEVKLLAGELYDSRAFEANAGPDGFVSRETFRKVASERGHSLDSSEPKRRFTSGKLLPQLARGTRPADGVFDQPSA